MANSALDDQYQAADDDVPPPSALLGRLERDMEDLEERLEEYLYLRSLKSSDREDC